MKQLSAIKCLTVFMLIFLMGNFAYGDTASSPDPLKLIAESKYYGKMTKDQAAEIIKTCTSNTYKTRSIVDKDNFLMDVPKETLAHPLVTRTKQIFKWTEVKHIQLLKKSIKLTYVTTFLGINSHGTLELDPQGYNLSDLALAGHDTFRTSFKSGKGCSGRLCWNNNENRS
ncbi:hypothetical protein [Desulfobacterium sp. N47]|uniref:Uncharacterized protein n=1 Tax=uncultured Desulfobacterium sp. TaxID=201089 RepID=E1YAK2_9BACT|nr:unknown protein [uncultured Desulfobacterium sp.]